MTHLQLWRAHRGSQIDDESRSNNSYVHHNINSGHHDQNSNFTLKVIIMHAPSTH